jgi:serine/threonine protein kinase
MASSARIDYPFEKDCRVEIIKARVETPGKEASNTKEFIVSPERFKSISEWTISLNSEYEEIRRVGKAVKLFRHRATDQEIAVKSFPPPSSAKKARDVQTRFVREIEILISLSHPCILGIRGCCPPSAKEGPKIICEWISGGSLKQVLAFPMSQPRWWTSTQKAITIAGIVMGMIYVHSRGIIARNLKPENVLLDDDHHVRICDLWSSRFTEQEVMVWSANPPIYLAPEVNEGSYGPKADIYSFGLIVYEIVAGQGLFSGPGDKSAMYRALQFGKRPEVPGDALKDTRRLIEKCWAQNAEERPSFEEVWSELIKLKFVLFGDVNPVEVSGFVRWVEGQDVRVSRPMKRGK